jgi:hypothetical protein
LSLDSSDSSTSWAAKTGKNGTRIGTGMMPPCTPYSPRARHELGVVVVDDYLY